MIIYSRNWQDDFTILREAKKWFERKLILKEQYDAIVSTYQPEFYTVNIFLRIALFIFTQIMVFGLLGLFVSITDITDPDVPLFVGLYGLFLYIVLENWVRIKHFYKAGVDDALLVASTICVIVGIEHFLPNERPEVIIYLISLPLLIWLTIRFSEPLVALALTGCLFYVMILLITNEGRENQILVPFAVMLISLPMFLFSRRYKKRISLKPWWSSFALFETSGLVALYLAGNYLIVRNYFEAENVFTVNSGHDIPFAGLFYALTVILPIVYTGAGLLRRDATLLRVGILALGFSLFTFKYYFIEGYTKLILTVGGALLLLIASFVSNYLKSPKRGFTLEHLLRRNFENVINLDEVIIFRSLEPSPAKKERA